MAKSLYSFEMALVATLYVRAESAAEAAKIAAEYQQMHLPDDVMSIDGPDIHGGQFENAPDVSFSPAMCIEGFANDDRRVPGFWDLADGEGHPDDDSFAPDAPAKPKPVLLITVDGGNIQSICSDRPGGIGARVIVVDYDNDDPEDDATLDINGDVGSVAEWEVDQSSDASEIAELYDDEARNRRIIARFVPQAWVNDSAIEVDPEGPTEWDVTDLVAAMGKDAALAIQDARDSSDMLRHAKTAPKWIADWSGPFAVYVTESIRAYYGTDDAEPEVKGGGSQYADESHIGVTDARMDPVTPADYEAAITDAGYKIATRDEYMEMEPIERGYALGPMARRFLPDEIPPGAWVVYDPNDDEDGWLLFGDDRAALIKETWEQRIDS